MDDPTSTYENAVVAVHRNQELIEQLEHEPPSPKRDAAITRLRDIQAQAILRLGDIGPTTLS